MAKTKDSVQVTEEKTVQEENKGNREYKSDVFSLLMEYPENALEVYNVLNHSEYTNPEDIEIIKLDHGVSLSIRNDASFIIDGHINYYEHQSTYCQNMPLRFLIYYVSDLQKDLKTRRVDLFANKKISIPTPHFIVFYNGEDNRPETEVMHLSSSFLQQTESPEIDIVCTAYNINSSNNERLKKESKVLYGYTFFVEKVRKFAEEMDSLEAAINSAIDECVAENILKDFFLLNRDEVVKMTEFDMTLEARIEYAREEERQNTEEQRKIAEEQRRIAEEERKRAEEANRRADKAEADAEKWRKKYEESQSIDM